MHTVTDSFPGKEQLTDLSVDLFPEFAAHVSHWLLEDLPRFLARIIHQLEKSTGQGDFVVQMTPKTTVSQVYEGPKSISSGPPDTIPIGWMGVTGHTTSCQPPGPPSVAWDVSHSGSLSIAKGLSGQAHTGQ
jgi:hypothetical protein